MAARLAWMFGLAALLLALGCSADEDLVEPSRSPDAGRRFVEQEPAEAEAEEPAKPRASLFSRLLAKASDTTPPFRSTSS